MVDFPIDDGSQVKLSVWEKAIPWFLTVASTLTLLALGWFLINNIIWFKENAFSVAEKQDTLYKMHIYHLHLSMIKRSVGLFAGFALLFIGTGVAFYSLKTLTHLNAKGAGLTIGLVTASPGIVAMIVGAAMIMYTVGSKDEFPPYVPNISNSDNNIKGSDLPTG